jgi:hypothetical protein
MLSAANLSEVNMRNSRTCKITALFSPSAHPQICDPSLQYSQEFNIQYIRKFLASRLHHIQRIENNMHSITLLSFIYPRQFRASAEVPLIVILNFSYSIRFPLFKPSSAMVLLASLQHAHQWILERGSLARMSHYIPSLPPFYV